MSKEKVAFPKTFSIEPKHRVYIITNGMKEFMRSCDKVWTSMDECQEKVDGDREVLTFAEASSFESTIEHNSNTAKTKRK